MKRFELVSEYTPKGDQIQAVQNICKWIDGGKYAQLILGITGSGKTYTIAQIIAKTQLPALVIAHNKTLAAQLFREFKHFFPENAVEYFVSYYDYFQPEAYVPSSDQYIAKEATINDEIDRMRHSTTRSLFERRDVIIVASVSCIYGLGSPDSYYGLQFQIQKGHSIKRHLVIKKLVSILYERNDIDLRRGTFRVRGDTIEVLPSYEYLSVRIEFFGNEVESIRMTDPLTGVSIREVESVTIYPNSHYVTSPKDLVSATHSIRVELQNQLQIFRSEQKLIEAQRLEERTEYDLEMMELVGYCAGIENYARHLTGREEGTPPPTLIDYLHNNTIVFIDESHATIPQIKAMYNADRGRKDTLVRHGFRLPSALDNRPLKFKEFIDKVHQFVFVSATPADWELELSEGRIAEQIIRPTGLLDPIVEVRSAIGQVDNLIGEIRSCVDRNERILVTTLTKRMAEDLSEYYTELGIRVRYLHSDIDTIERTRTIRALRLGEFDVLIGINLLREGLDLPEVALVAILDADKEGFLRSQTSLIQTIGRCSRNVNGHVLLYADTITTSIRNAIDETERRREIQTEYNRIHGITPESIQNRIHGVLSSVAEADYYTVATDQEDQIDSVPQMESCILQLTEQMTAFARGLEFEKAAEIRDRIKELKHRLLELSV